MPNFTIPDFLRLIRKGPEERPEWWRKCWHAPNGGIPIDQLPESVECDTWEPVLCPFYTIVTGDWTPEKDALLLGAGLEWYRNQHSWTQCDVDDGLDARWLRFDVQPGLTLARAIWAAMKCDK
jgi:hypothetical protein